MTTYPKLRNGSKDDSNTGSLDKQIVEKGAYCQHKVASVCCGVLQFTGSKPDSQA